MLKLGVRSTVYLVLLLSSGFLISMTEVTFPDGDFNGAENGIPPNHAAKRTKLSFNDTEGRGYKINSSSLIQKSPELQPPVWSDELKKLIRHVRNMTLSVYY